MNPWWRRMKYTPNQVKTQVSFSIHFTRDVILEPISVMIHFTLPRTHSIYNHRTDIDATPLHTYPIPSSPIPPRCPVPFNLGGNINYSYNLVPVLTPYSIPFHYTHHVGSNAQRYHRVLYLGGFSPRFHCDPPSTHISVDFIVVFVQSISLLVLCFGVS